MQMLVKLITLSFWFGFSTGVHADGEVVISNPMDVCYIAKNQNTLFEKTIVIAAEQAVGTHGGFLSDKRCPGKLIYVYSNDKTVQNKELEKLHAWQFDLSKPSFAKVIVRGRFGIAKVPQPYGRPDIDSPAIFVFNYVKVD